LTETSQLNYVITKTLYILKITKENIYKQYLKTDIFPKLVQATTNFPHGEKHWQNTVV